MAKTTTYSNDVLAQFYNAVALPWDASSALYVSLHTSSPGIGGDQTTNEVSTAAYVNYARVSFTRDAVTDPWTVSGGSTSNPTALTFAQAGAGSTGATITFFGIGTGASGAGALLRFGSITSPAGGLIISEGVIPEFPAGNLTSSEA
jgi:hypothetical protein